MELEKDIVLHPKYFGPRLKQRLTEKLYNEVEGTCSGERGYIVAVTSLNEDNISRGKLMAGKGLVTYHVQYNAVVFRPVKGEVMDAVVTVVNKVGRVALRLVELCGSFVRDDFFALTAFSFPPPSPCVMCVRV